MKKFNNNVYRLDEFHRDELLKIEKDRNEKNIDEEEYVREKIRKSDITIINGKKCTNTKDDGVDFGIIYSETIYICQVKYRGKPLGKKEIKEIYGSMLLSEFALKCKEENKNLKYFLICPFINMCCDKLQEQYSKEGYYLITNEKFIDLLTNPKYFFEYNLYER